MNECANDQIQNNIYMRKNKEKIKNEKEEKK